MSVQKARDAALEAETLANDLANTLMDAIDLLGPHVSGSTFYGELSTLMEARDSVLRCQSLLTRLYIPVQEE